MRLDNKQVMQKYNDFASKYDKAESIGELIILKKLRRRIISGLKGKILELGIGTGRNLSFYSSDCEITGIDFSNEMLKIAKRRAKLLGKRAKFVMGDVHKLPFGKGKFDYAVDTLGMCTYSNPIAVLKEMKRVCKKNGKIILIEHGKSSFWFVRKIQKLLRKGHLNRIGCDLLRNPHNIVLDSGLKIEKVERKLFGIIYIVEIRV